MGCSWCKSDDVLLDKRSDNSSNKVSVYDRRRRVSIRVGCNAHRLAGKSPILVFIFGGPGSKKGRVVDDLIMSYGFRFISVEDIVFVELPKKVQYLAKLENTKDLKSFLEDDSSHFTLDWALHMIERRLEREDPSVSILVDLVPNLKCLLNSDAFTHEKCAEKLQMFDDKYPISFALNLAVPNDRLVQVKQGTMLASASSDRLKETGGQGDEQDVARVQKRKQVYEQAVKQLLDHFNRVGKLITVDVVSGEADIIWHRVHTVFCELGFEPKRTVNTVIVFVFDSNEAKQVDLTRFCMQCVALADIADKQDNSADKLMQKLSFYIDSQSKETEAFVVDLSNTVLTQANIASRKDSALKFSGIQECSLETYLPGTPRDYMPTRNSVKFKAVASLEKEICLFPSSTSDRLCHVIASYFHNARKF